MYKTEDSIRKELKDYLEKKLEEYVSRQAAWKEVEFKTKKDGTPFQKLSMAISGAYFGDYGPVEDKAHPYITVYPKPSNPDHLPAFFYVDCLPKDDPRASIVSKSILRATTPKTLDEIKFAIEERILQYQNYIDATREILGNLSDYCNRFITPIFKIRANIEDLGAQDVAARQISFDFLLREKIKEIL